MPDNIGQKPDAAFTPKAPNADIIDGFMAGLEGKLQKSKLLKVAIMVCENLVSQKPQAKSLQTLQTALGSVGVYKDWQTLRASITSETSGWVQKAALWLVHAGENNETDLTGIRHALSIVWFELPDENILSQATATYSQ